MSGPAANARASRLILALDQGTTSSRAVLLDGQGRCLGEGRCDSPCSFPKPGWVEADPRTIWSSQLAAARAAIEAAGVPLTAIAAIGLTNQRETVMLWRRRDGEPLGPAIVWQDRRTSPRTDALRAEGLEPWIRSRTGLLCDPYFSASKVEWLLDEVPQARRLAEQGELAMGTVDSWLLWNLTGGRVHATDPSNASRTLLWNLARREWDRELLDLFRIPESLLPEVRPSSGDFGRTDGGIFGAELPICGVIGDQQAALAGQGCMRPGQGKITFGTGCFLLVNAGDSAPQSRSRLLSTAAWTIGDAAPVYAIEGSVFMGGALVGWLRDGLGLIGASAEIGPLAEQAGDSGGVVVVPSFTGLGAPHWDASARGAILGLTRGTGPPQIARAALEGIAQQVADVCEAAESDLAFRPEAMRVDGGAAACDELMRLCADLLDCAIERPADLESTVRGAAVMAGVAVGLVDPQTGLPERTPPQRFEPRIDAASRAALRSRWSQAVACVREFGSGEAAGASP
jgi:glycerol kinase